MSDSEETTDVETEGSNTGTPTPVAEFLEHSEKIFHEYDEGYLDPDSALSRLGDRVAELRDTYEDES